MADTPLAPVVRHLHKLAGLAPMSNVSDALLLERFVQRRDEDAFAALVRRHGPLVWRVCRRVLHQRQHAEEAYQAVFLVLVRQAAKVRNPAALASFLYGVAYRIARQARADLLRQSRQREPIAAPVANPADEAAWREVERIVVEEVHALPEKYRTPILLCYWEGLTNEEAAGRLGWPAGTVKTRLLKARQRLHERLTRRGVSLASGAVVTLFAAGSGDAALPPILAAATARLALDATAGVSTAAVALAEHALQGAALPKVKIALVLLLGSAIAAGVGALAYRESPTRQPEVQPKAKSREAEPSKARTEQRTIRTDRYGDPLPAEALARLGTVRFRQGTSVHITQFSPDGKNLLLGGAGEKCLSLWDVASGKRVLDFPIDFPNRAAISPNGKLLAVADLGTSLWEMSSGRRMKTLDKAFGAAVAFAADGNTLAVGTEQGVNLWDVAAGKKLRHLSHGATVRGVAFPVGGKTLVSAGEDGTVRLWDVNSGKELRRWDMEKGPAHDDMAASPTAPWVALADEKTLRMFNVQTGKEIRLLGPDPYQRGAVAFSADGKLLASAHDPGQMYIWDAATGKEKLRWKTTRLSMFRTLAFSPDGNTLVSSGHDSSGVQWWDVATGKEIDRPQVGHGGWVKAIGFRRDGKDLFSLSGDGEFLSWSTDGKNHTRSQLPFSAGAGFSPDGKTTLSADWDGKIGGGFVVRLRDSATGKEIRSLGKVPLANQVAFSPDGKSLALAEFENGTLTVSVWDLMSGKPRHRFARPGHRLYFCLAFSPDGKKIAAGSWAERPNFHLWDLDTGKEIPSCNPDHWVNSIVFSPDGSLVALGSGGDHKNCLSVWNLATAKELQRFAVSGMEVVSAFSPSGRFVVTGASLKAMARGPKAEDSAVGVWEIATGKEVASFQGHQSSITTVAFAPDGKSLASGGGDSTILIWDLAGQLRHGQRRQSLTAAELQTRWQDLAGGDAALAYKAIGDLVFEGDAAVAFLKTRLFPVPPPDAALARRATQLVEELNADAFDVRQKASRELEKMGEAAVPALRKALASRPSLEVRRRVEQILAGFEGKEASLQLRKSRALEALELIATPAARELLRSLAQGEATARLTQEARAAHQRLGQ